MHQRPQHLVIAPAADCELSVTRCRTRACARREHLPCNKSSHTDRMPAGMLRWQQIPAEFASMKMGLHLSLLMLGAIEAGGHVEADRVLDLPTSNRSIAAIRQRPFQVHAVSSQPAFKRARSQEADIEDGSFDHEISVPAPGAAQPRSHQQHVERGVMKCGACCTTS